MIKVKVEPGAILFLYRGIVNFANARWAAFGFALKTLSVDVGSCQSIKASKEFSNAQFAAIVLKLPNARRAI